MGTMSRTWMVTGLLALAGCAAAREYESQRMSLAERPWPIADPPARETVEALPDDLSAYIREAAQHNAGLRSAFDRWRAALERVPQVTALPDPMLGYGHFIESVETRVGPQRERVMLEQKLPWPGKLSQRGRAALAAAEAAREELEAERLRVIYEVTRLYHEYAYLADAIRITEENKKLVANVEEVARTLLEGGRANQQHVIAAQVELGRIEDHLRTLTDRRLSLVASLNALLNRPADAPLAWPHPDRGEPPAVDETAVTDALRLRNPTLLAIEQRIRQADAAVELARLDYWPDVAVGITWIDTDEAMMPDVPDSGKDPVLATVSINLPIWLRKLRAGVRGAEAARAEMLAMRVEMENRLRARLADALFRLRDANRQVKLYGDSLIPKAEQALKTAQTGYSAGTVTFQGLVDSLRLLLEFQLARERALADRAQRQAEVRMLAPEEEMK